MNIQFLQMEEIILLKLHKSYINTGILKNEDTCSKTLLNLIVGTTLF